MQISVLAQSIADDQLLLEANVLNVGDVYDDVSLKKYLEGYARSIGDDQIAKQFVKKMSKFLMNDDTWLHAVRELPADAPDWAQKAYADRELVYFKPDQALNDKVSHISHYLAAAVSDAETGGHDAEGKPKNDNNIKVFATRELQGFPKIGDLETLKKKSDEYFARGAKDEHVGDTTGMVEIADTGGGVKWYLLQTNEAFRREGKTLQNCIGTHWTLNKTKNAGESIVVMRLPNGESVVAARIKNKSNELQEMKGKNNKPPIDKYMGSVLKFMRQKKLKIGGARYDFEQAGYFHVDGQMYSRAEALKKFVKHKDLGDVGDKQLVEVVYDPEVSHILDSAYNFADTLGYGYREQMKNGKIYELRDGTGHASLSALVVDGEIVALKRNKRQVVESLLESVDNTQGDAQRLIKKLFDLGVAKRVGEHIGDDLFWNDRLKIDQEGNTTPVEHKKKQHHKKGHKWEHYTDRETINQVYRTLTSGYSSLPIESADDIESIYMQGRTVRGDNYTSIAIHTKDGQMIPVGVNKAYRGFRSDERPSAGADGVGRDEKTASSYVELANHHNLKLPRSFKHHHGVLTDADGKHERYDPEGEDLGDGITKFDLSDMDGDDRAIAARAIITNSRIRGRGGVHKPDAGDFDEHPASSERTQHIKVPRDVPDTMYTFGVNFGAGKTHKMLVMANGDKVVQVDDTSLQHPFQHWDDYGKVADQMNQFFKKAKLKLPPKKALFKSKESKELRSHRGQITTGTRLADKRAANMQARGAFGNEGTDELPLDDGTRVVRMKPDEQTKYLRQDLGVNATPGEGWKIVGSDGKIDAVAFVKNKQITRIRSDERIDQTPGHGTPRAAGTLPTGDGPPAGKTLNHLKSAADAFGWTIKPSILSSMKRKLEKSVRIGYGRHRHSSDWDMLRSMKWRSQDTRKGEEKEKILKRLQQRGWVVPTKKDDRYTEWTLSKQGKKVVDHSTGYSEDALQKALWDTIEPTGLEQGYEVPPEKTPPKEDKPKKEKAATTRAADTTAQPRTGTKAQQALDTYKDFVDDNDRIPTRQEFMALLMDEPYNMSKAGASTYHANTVKKYAALNERYSNYALIRSMGDVLMEMQDVLYDRLLEA